MADKLVDVWQGVTGAIKHAASHIPGLGEAIAGWDAYKRSGFERSLRKTLDLLNTKVDNPERLFKSEWLQSAGGQTFSRKVLDCVFDVQLEDKQELFVNALINGILDQELVELEKLKFVDILRNLSKASLMVLADLHALFKGRVRGTSHKIDPTSAFPLVDPAQLSKQLSTRFHPYLVSSSIYEMQSQGLFSSTGEWRKMNDGTYIQGGGFADALCYTAFTYNFIEFITEKRWKKEISES
jgi:hypothetical protein